MPQVQEKYQSSYTGADLDAAIARSKAITATDTELNYSSGVTSAIQTQLNAKQSQLTVNPTTTSATLTGLTIDGTSYGIQAEPAAYIKNAAVDATGNQLTLTKKDDSTVVFAPESGKVDDVKVNGTSVVTDKVANISLAEGEVDVTLTSTSISDGTTTFAITPNPATTTASLTGLTVGGTAYAIAAEPEAFIKNASVSNKTLTLTKKDDSTVTFTDTGSIVTGTAASGKWTELTIDGTSHSIGGGPDTYLKNASVADTVLTITKQDDTTVTYDPQLIEGEIDLTLTSTSISDGTTTFAVTANPATTSATLSGISIGGTNYAVGGGPQNIHDGANSALYQTDNTATGSHAFAEGWGSNASGDCAHAEGETTVASEEGAHAEGVQSTASNAGSHAEGYATVSSGTASHAEGGATKASGETSHAEGLQTAALGDASHAEGTSTNLVPDTITSTSTESVVTTAWTSAKFSLAQKAGSHVEGKDTLALGDYAHAEGDRARATATDAHAEGYLTIAAGNYSHAEGGNSRATGAQSHAEGANTTASGTASHAEGSGTTASADNAHAEGNQTLASSAYQHVQGKFNVEDSAGTYADIVGWGTAAASRANIETLTTTGVLWTAGGFAYETTAPTSDNTTGGLKLVVLSSEPATKYNGYIYIITA